MGPTLAGPAGYTEGPLDLSPSALEDDAETDLHEQSVHCLGQQQTLVTQEVPAVPFSKCADSLLPPFPRKSTSAGLR